MALVFGLQQLMFLDHFVHHVFRVRSFYLPRKSAEFTTSSRLVHFLSTDLRTALVETGAGKFIAFDTSNCGNLRVIYLKVGCI